VADLNDIFFMSPVMSFRHQDTCSYRFVLDRLKKILYPQDKNVDIARTVPALN